jgi:VWFA-related protein
MTVPRLLALALVCAALLAQDSTPNRDTIRANVHLVLVPVTVTDAKGKFVDGLGPQDFVLYDDGVPQRQLQVDSSDTVLAPVALVVAIQSSGISQPALAKIHKIGGMLQPLVSGEKGEAAVLSYDADVRALQDFTRDSSKINGAFESIQAQTIKAGKMLDAVLEGVRMLGTAPESNRRMMLILGESRDRGSKAKLDQVIEAAQRSSVTMYSLTYSAQATAWTATPGDDPALPIEPDYAGGIVEALRLTTRNAADEFAKWTGGRHLSFTRLEGLEDAIQRLSAEVHSQYLLSFAPQESRNKGLHRLIVQVRGHKGAQIRARPGYWP